MLAQRQAKQSVTLNAETDQMLAASVARAREASQGKPGPKPKATSKRNDPDWVAATFYVKAETKAQMDRYLALTKLDARPGSKHPGDQSELIEQALAAWLAKQMPKLEAEVLGR